MTAIISAQLAALRPDDAVLMAQQRGSAQLPYWSILAMAEYYSRGFSRQEIARAFCCSKGTVARALQWKATGYEPITGRRRLTAAQQKPPGQFTKQ